MTAREESLEQQREQLAAIIEQMPAGLVVAEAPGGRLVSVNDEARRIMGAFDGLAEYVNGRAPRRPNGVPYRPEELPLARAVENGEVVLAERIEIQDPERGPVIIEVSAAPVRDAAGRILLGVAMVRDITLQELRERAERDFIANAAHELQSPLAAITSAVEVLQAGAKDTENRDLFLGHIDREAQRLGRLTRALLTLARAQTRVEAPRDELIELCPMLEGIAGRMEPADGVILTVDCPRHLGVLSNRDLLVQAVSNVVRNSVAHTSRGSIHLKGLAAADGDIEISVADTGRGIAAEALPRIFDRFYRSDPTREGFGLGLAIVHASIEVLGGAMDIESSLGEGTTVRMTLPAGATLVRRAR